MSNTAATISANQPIRLYFRVTQDGFLRSAFTPQRTSTPFPPPRGPPPLPTCIFNCLSSLPLPHCSPCPPARHSPSLPCLPLTPLTPYPPPSSLFLCPLLFPCPPPARYPLLHALPSPPSHCPPPPAPGLPSCRPPTHFLCPPPRNPSPPALHLHSLPPPPPPPLPTCVSGSRQAGSPYTSLG